jgi:hydrogenase expression/formation protein HypD
LKNGEAKIENQYARLVKDTGNASALNPIATVFELRDFFEWRGLGARFATTAMRHSNFFVLIFFIHCSWVFILIKSIFFPYK